MTRSPRTSRAAVLLGVLLALGPGTALAADVVVRAEQSGQGIARLRGSECFVITPRHVVAQSVDISVIAADVSIARATVVTTFANDIAVLRIQADPARACEGVRWSTGDKLDARLANQATGTLRVRHEDGSLRQIPVHIDAIDPQRFITISPLRASDQFSKGMSGGVVHVGGEPAGMLLEVDATRGTGRVMRQDYLSTLIDRFFASGRAATSAAERPQVLWRWRTGIQSWRNNPQFVGKHLFVGSSGSTWNAPDALDGVYAFDVEAGQQVWFTRTSADFNDLAYIDGLIVGGTDAGEVVALSATTGKVVWKAAFGGPVYARPVNVGSGIVVATGAGDLLLLDLRTGKLLSRVKLDGGVRAGLTVADYDLWATTEAGMLYQLSVFGSLSVRRRIPLVYPDEYGKPPSAIREMPAGARKYDALGKGKYSTPTLYAAPLVRGNGVIVGFVRQTSYDYPAVAALDKSGSVLWYGSDEKNVVGGFGNVRFTPAYHDGLVLLGNPYSNRVYALAESTGKVVWQTALGQQMFQHWAAPVVHREFAYFAQHNGFLHKLRAKTGARLWSIFLGLDASAGVSLLAHEQVPGMDVRPEWQPAAASPIFATPAISGNLIAVGTDEGHLYVVKDF